MIASSRFRLLGLLALFALAAGGRALAADPAERAVPAGSAVYISGDPRSVLEFWNRLKESPLGGLLGAGPAGNSGSRGRLASLLPMVMQMIEGRAALALSAEKPAPGQPAAVLAILPLKDARQLRMMEGLLPMLLQAEQVEIATRDYQGVKITTLSGPRFRGSRPSYALVDSELLVASLPEWLEKSLDSLAGRAPSLAAATGFQQLRERVARMGDNSAWFWLDPARLNPDLLRGARVENGAAPSPGSASGPAWMNALRPVASIYQAVGGRLCLSDAGAVVDALAVVNPQSEIGRQFLAGKGGAMRSAALVPDSAVLYAAVNNLPATLQMMRAAGEGVRGDLQRYLTGALQTFQAATGLDPQTDFLDHIGSEGALALTSVPEKLGWANVPAEVYVEAKSKPGIDKTMRAVRAALAQGLGVQFEEKSGPQGPLFLLQPDTAPFPLSLGWTYAGDFLVFGMQEQALRQSLDLAKGSGGALSATPAYRQAVTAAGDRLMGAFYLDVTRGAPLLEKLLASGKPPASGGDRAQEAAGVIRTVSAYSALDKDAVAYHIDLAMDLSRRP